MATALSYSAHDALRQTGTAGAWPLLARIPDLSATSLGAAGSASAAPTTGDKAIDTRPAYRFDPPEPLSPHSAAQASARKPLAKALVRLGHAAASQAVSQALPRATGLPLWAAKPAAVLAGRSAARLVRSKSLSELAGSIVRFLLLVALFTAAGLSVLMMNGPHRKATTAPMDSLSPHAEQSAAAPTALGPQGNLAVGVGAPFRIAAPRGYPGLRNEQTPNPSVESPSAEPQSEIRNPQSEISTPAVATLPGYILEVPARQAQHDNDESSIH